MKYEFTVKGMRCAGCAANLQKKISKMDGVKQCSVNIASNNMILECDPSEISIDEIISAVKKSGFQAELQTEDQPVIPVSEEETTSVETEEVATEEVATEEVKTEE